MDKTLLTVICICLASFTICSAQSEVLQVDLRSRVKNRPAGPKQMINQIERWDASQTAIIICDMWDKHWCESATKRVAELAPYMNEVVSLARDKGVFIIHAPSDVVDYYEEHPARERAQQAPEASNQPEDIQSWCDWINPEEEEVYPIDQTDGGCDCGDCESYTAWEKQIETIDIFDDDAISNSGTEIWNLLESKGIENVILLGVHTNMCVLGRPFGLRNMAKYGKNVVLMRDLTDTMYNPESWPYVNHFTGTDLIVEHIEKYICPTVTSTVFTGKPAFRFSEDQRPRVLLIHAEDEYRAEETLPQWGNELQITYDLAIDYAVGISNADGKERHYIAGLEELTHSDLAVLYVRRRALPKAQMNYIKEYLSEGKPLLAIRTSSHAFDARTDIPDGYVDWPFFDQEVLGGNYHGHFGHGAPESIITVNSENSSHPIVQGGIDGYKTTSWLYKTGPVSEDAEVLMTGKIDGQEAQAVSWYRNYQDSKIFYTSLGHWKDFEQEAFKSMLNRTVFWLLERDMPEPNLMGSRKLNGEK